QAPVRIALSDQGIFQAGTQMHTTHGDGVKHTLLAQAIYQAHVARGRRYGWLLMGLTALPWVPAMAATEAAQNAETVALESVTVTATR
ncbi:TonB-dependent receptor, partial [Pseudomonas syringae pv. actinidiae ICMP 18807]